ncbi:MAG: flagellar protein FlaG [Lachnospiraceae bacterium]|nr:flagellar protein FlaG [Lachnospiraceae bacterium]
MTTEVNTNYTEHVNKTECIVKKISKNTEVEHEGTAVKGQEMVALEEEKKEPTSKQIKSALEQANQKAKMTKTACEFAYDEETRRISITVKDKETDEVIREIPAEETLEMISKIWEFAGLLVDEKR